MGQQQDPAGQGDIAAESSTPNAAVGSGESGLVAEEAQPQHIFHLPAHLDVSDGSGVKPSSASRGRSEC